MYVLGGFLSSVGDAIMDGIRTFMLTLCDGIYRLIYMTYFMFEKLGTAKIITDDQIAGIFRRVGLIIGIFMLFRLTFAFIQYIVDPDAMTDNKKGMGNIIKKILISIVLLGSTSTLFNLAFKVQNLIIDNHIISKVIFNSNASASDDFGAELSADVFTSFFRLNPDATGTDAYCAPLITKDSSGKSVIYNSIAKNNGELTEAYKCITDKDKNGEYIATFDGGGFIALVVGVIVLYTLLIYTIQVGVRVIQLAYLQIIAPVPIMMYITPQGEDKLKKWGQQCLTTFLDFFLRTMIIYFAVFVIQNIWENDTIGTILTAGHSNSNNWQTAYIGVIMIIAVLVFAKKAPNLIKEIFPSLGGAAGFDYGLSFKKQVVEPLKTGYNSPLGWGLKFVGKGAAAIDRKKYGLPRPRGKLGQAVDKWLPGQAEARQNKNKAIIESKQREAMLKAGEKLNATYPSGDSLVAAFKNKEYQGSYMNLRKAKKEAGAAELELEAARSDLNTAVASRNQEAIKIAKERLKTATDNLHSTQGNLELAKTRHESNKKIYTKDAEIEAAYKYYADTHSEHKEYEREMPDLSGQSQQEQINETLQEILRRQSGNPSNNTPTEGHANSRQERNSGTTSGSGVQERVNNATGVSKPSASENGAPTVDNSLLGELADQVEQERLRNDVLNNLRNDNNNNNNGNR